ncbi:Mysoin-binding motif of peroxisomes-domain-containing protein [Absidia repens]|uniref:Inheritance of peroxisomes protein 2 n=1 Tax=Absidia repens TaxID=90262 RepID=A0A1X2I969_9FUNG|nr:Mysoin-binding motif of peroxisomes-domain-containing protein [Absidia repens]
MSEFVVYEDTPIAEYLNSIESGESSVKPAPLHLGIHQTDMKPKTFTIAQLSESLYRYWRQSLFHDTFSVSLPIMEEMAFEEKFKYLIVTSPLLNDTLSAHPKQKQQKLRRQSSTGPPPFHATAAHTRAGRIGTMATLSSLLAAIGLERFFPFVQYQHRHQHHQVESTALVTKAITPTITMALASGVSLYFIYRHLRRSSIRKLYQCALTQLQDVLEQSQLLDGKVHRALLTIQEIELVSRGYRLSTPLSPISRIEQASKSKKCARLRMQLAGLLRHAFIIYEEAIIDMTDRVNKPTLSRLFDMYNIHSVASLSAASIPTEHNSSTDNENDITLDYLKTLAHLMHLKRRECMLQFLALSVMTGGHDSIRNGYEAGWRNINTVLAMLGKETKGFVNQVVEAMETEFSKSSALDMDNASDSSLSTNTDTRQFIHRLSTLDQHLRTMEARVYLCNDELQKRQRALSSSSSKSPNNQTAEDKDIMKELEQQQQSLKLEYMAMEKDIQQLAIEWESGKTALDSLLTPPPPSQAPVINTDDMSPAPLPTPSMTPTADHDDHHPFIVVNSYEASELLDLPLASKASVYESVDDELLDNAATNVNADQPKKSRMERIAEMKQKREQEAKEKSSKLDSQTYVYELKNVLDRRIQELDLANDGQPSQ